MLIVGIIIKNYNREGYLQLCMNLEFAFFVNVSLFVLEACSKGMRVLKYLQLVRE